jgi:hypothetical protein
MGPFHPETAPPPLRLLRSVGPERNGQDDLVKLRVIRTTPDFQHRVLLVPRIPRTRKVARRTERNRATVPIAISHSVLYDPTRGLFYYTSYIQNAWSFGGSYVDTTPYPASGGSSWETPGDCLTDAQIQAEVQKVMALKGWTGGLNKMFFVYTSSAEGSCAGFGCAYSDYCAYHSYFYSGSTPVIYGNEPYADTRCQLSGTPSPNGDPAADAAASVTSHELTEAITDPLLNAWYSAAGAEIGDRCVELRHQHLGLCVELRHQHWAGGTANQSWYEFIGLFIIGHPPVGSFELQQEYDNHVGGCVQVGP